MSYQLCLGDEPLWALIDRLVTALRAAVPALDEAACRELVDLVFRARVRQTEACGRHPECLPARGAERPAGWLDLDPDALPAMFGAAAAALIDVATASREHLERRLADVFRAVVSPLLVPNPSCGRAAICRAAPTFPLRRG